ncbi:hypothetical protein PIROE2DRAFT_17511 [Piromyces sp. E2]|nr:hypothetical protein PIROE2DRAFT_17511 [Piromyces sp. E2]|eukprot:OUM57491.1 hypothetical protein PIROE2DRAFT_17511 [Piromyces sp. E2]
MTKSLAIGIDLGTTNSCVAVYRNNQAEVIPNDQGNRISPSCVSYTSTERLVGDAASLKAAMNYENTIYDAKRLIGRRFNDSEVQMDRKHWPFKVVEKHGKPYVRVQYKGKILDITPEEISSVVLSKLKETAEDYIGEEVEDAVITVPAYFNDSQRRATKDAATIAGLNVLRIINEPTAAALAYGINTESKEKKNVLIIDFGGGTFDVSLLTIKDGTFTVRATAGDTHLGGEDFTNRLKDYFVQEFQKKYNKDISTNKRSLHRLRIACERAKCILSTSKYASIEIDYLYDGMDFCSGITRSCFEELNEDLFNKILDPISNVLKDSGLKKSEIHDIVLVGGSTRIPKIQELISSFFNGKELKKTINPDEAVACGAAVHAANLSGVISEPINNLHLVDVIPLSLGVANRGIEMCTVIKRNSPIPIKKTVTRVTLHDNQTSMKFIISEGERTLIKDNTTLDEFTLDGITPAPRGETKAELTFDIDENGILKVLAVEKNTGLYKKITVSNDKGRLYQNEINRLIKEAERFKEDDKMAKERIDSMNKLDDYAYDLRKHLKNGKKNTNTISSYNEKKLTEAIYSTIEWVKDNPDAPKEEYDRRRKELEIMFKPILCY